MLGDLDNILTHSRSTHSDRLLGGGKAELSVGITMSVGITIWSGEEPLQSWKAAHFMWPSALLEEQVSATPVPAKTRASRTVLSLLSLD